jgi:hypothetical protein
LVYEEFGLKNDFEHRDPHEEAADPRIMATRKVHCKEELNKILSGEKTKETADNLRSALERSLQVLFTALTVSRRSGPDFSAARSPTVEAAGLIFQSLKGFPPPVKASLGLTKGGRVLNWAMLGIKDGYSRLPPEDEKDEKPVIRALVDFADLITRRWGIQHCWKACEGLVVGTSFSVLNCSPLAMAALTSSVALTKLVLGKSGGQLHGSPLHSAMAIPLSVALFGCTQATFDFLLDQGTDLARVSGDYLLLFTMLDQVAGEKDLDIRAKRLAMLRGLFKKRPEAIQITLTRSDGTVFSLLDGAIGTWDVEVVEFVIELMGKEKWVLQYRSRSNAIGNREYVYPTIRNALNYPSKAVLELLITKYRLLEDWQRKYSEQSQGVIAAAVARLAVATFPAKEGCLLTDEEETNGSRFKPLVYREGNEELLEAVIKGGWNRSFDQNGVNAVLDRLLNGGKGCVLSEDDAVALVRRLHEAGFDVLHYKRKGAPPLCPQPVMLHHMACLHRLPRLLAFAIDELGVNINDWCEAFTEDGKCHPGTPLLMAIGTGDFDLLIDILRRYKPVRCYPDKDPGLQPVTCIVGSTDFNDEQKVMLIRELSNLAPDLLTAVDWSNKSEVENPLAMAAGQGAQQTLVALLELPGGKELCAAPATIAVNDGQLTSFTASLAHVAAIREHWSALETILQAVDSPHFAEKIRFVGRNGKSAFVTEDGSLEELLERAKDPPPRFLTALVQAAMTKGGAKGDEHGIATASTSLSNVPEHPSPSPRAVLSDREAKKRAKKRAAKRKAKDKKAKETMGAAGGAGKETEYVDSSEETDDEDDDYEDEGRDDLVDSRNAPDLTVMLAAMRKAAALKPTSGKEKEGPR